MVTELTEDTFDDFVEKNAYVLIDCWAPWCGPCRRMGPIIDELAEELKGKVAVGKLNVDDAPGISARFEITAIPTLLMFNNKVEAEPLVGLRPKEDILAAMNDAGIAIKPATATTPADSGAHPIEVTDVTFDAFIKSKPYAIVDCWATWCGPCKRMGPIIEKLAAISGDDIAVGKLDVDKNQAVSMKYNIESIPTLLLYKGGKQTDVIVGLDPSLTPESLKKRIMGQ